MCMRRKLALFIAAVAQLFTPAVSALDISLAAPPFTVRIPDLEDFELGPHPNAGSQPSARLFGQAKNGTTLSVLTPTSSPDSTASQCASWLAGNVVSRFVPALDSLQIVKLSDSAFVLVFPFTAAGVEQLKAFIVSGNGKGHCLEVHISRMNATDEQRKDWLRGFRDMQVQAK